MRDAELAEGAFHALHCPLSEEALPSVITVSISLFPVGMQISQGISL